MNLSAIKFRKILFKEKERKGNGKGGKQRMLSYEMKDEHGRVVYVARIMNDQKALWLLVIETHHLSLPNKETFWISLLAVTLSPTLIVSVFLVELLYALRPQRITENSKQCKNANLGRF